MTTFDEVIYDLKKALNDARFKLQHAGYEKHHISMYVLDGSVSLTVYDDGKDKTATEYPDYDYWDNNRQ